MRAALFYVAITLQSWGTAAGAWTPSTDNAFDIDAASAEKWSADRGGGVPNPIYLNVGGDTIGSASPIAALPFSDMGNTCEFTHQYDEVCPYNLPGAPDVVYSFMPASDVNAALSVCDSNYDTKLYVYENDVGNLVACNDDVCGSDGFKSEIEFVSLAAGNTYYIVVDGWSPTDCGNYLLVAEEAPDCVVSCPPGAMLEGESDCQDDTLDSTNGGCNSDPPVFSTIPCGPTGPTLTICGTYGGFLYSGHGYRDTDWYRLERKGIVSITACVTGEYDTIFGIIDGDAGCPVSSFQDYALAESCTETCLNAVVADPDDAWFFIATSGFGPSAGACGGRYTLTVTGAECVGLSVEPTSWGAIKNLYK